MSALGVLRRPTSLAQPVLLALDNPSVAREQPGLFENGPQLLIEHDEGSGDAETKRIGLTCEPASSRVASTS